MHAEIAKRHLDGFDELVATRPPTPAWRRALSAVFTIAVIACVVYLWPARLGGGTNMVVVRGTSMEPVYHLNDVVISREAASYEVGDIVLFSIPEGAGEGMLVIHRLVGQRDDGSWITQGDNRDAPDEFKLQDDDLHGKPVFVAPRAGRLIVWANNVYVISTAIGLLVILLLWPKKPQPEEVAVVAGSMAAAPSRAELEGQAAESVRVSAAVRELIAAVQLAADRRAVEQLASDVAAEAEAWLAEELARLGVSV